jgi:hypothetical protein
MLALEPVVVRRVFETWTLEIPESFDETFVADDGYWHGWDDSRSVSMTSVVITAKRGAPAPTGPALVAMLSLDGDRLDGHPPGVHAQAVTRIEEAEGRGLVHVLQGIIAVFGRLVLLTVTGGEPAWAVRTWLSVRYLARQDRRGRDRPKKHRHGR